jgi:hypothetical protein
MKSEPMTTERPEHNLLRLCVRRRLAPTESASIRQLLRGDLDWAYLADLASRHRVLPLLTDCLRAEGESAVPSAVLMILDRHLEVVHARNHHLALELSRLHRLATAAGIRLLSFKGPLLAVALYGDLGLRQFGDLDILADGASFATTEQFLATLGYQCARDFGYEVAFINDTINVAVDLHRALSPDNFPVAVSFAQLWARREIVSLQGQRLETLSASDLLIAMCIEAVKDARQGKVRLGKISDIAHLVMSELDWARVEAEARQLGLRRVVGFGIALVADVLRLPVPAPPALMARHPRLATFHREAENAVFANANTPRPSRLHGDRFHFHIRESWRDKLRPYVLWAHRLVTPNALDRDVVALPTWLSFLYYVVRPLRLARLYARQRAATDRLRVGGPGAQRLIL